MPTCDLRFVNGLVPKLYETYGRAKASTVSNMGVHLCGKKSCNGYATRLHTGERCYVAQDEKLADTWDALNASERALFTATRASVEKHPRCAIASTYNV